jgi:hypothetical protein
MPKVITNLYSEYISSYKIRDTKLNIKSSNDTRIKDYFAFSPTVTKRNYLIKKSGIHTVTKRKSLLEDVSVDNFKKAFERINDTNHIKTSNYFN